MIWLQSRAWQILPSKFIGVSNEYVAKCFDDAVYYFGITVEHELDMASHKPSKDERKASEARKRRLNKLLQITASEKAQYLDPAQMFM